MQEEEAEEDVVEAENEIQKEFAEKKVAEWEAAKEVAEKEEAEKEVAEKEREVAEKEAEKEEAEKEVAEVDRHGQERSAHALRVRDRDVLVLGTGIADGFWTQRFRCDYICWCSLRDGR